MKKLQRMVAKIGTGALRTDGRLDQRIFWDIASQVAIVKHEGYEVFLISSGAVDAGKEYLTLLGIDFSSLNDGELSSIGTSRLLRLWEDAFLPHQLTIATSWLTHSDFRIRVHRENLRISGGKLSAFPSVVPVGNENDLISRTELRKMPRGTGDNDYLARRVACLLQANIFLILTEAGGIWNGKPYAAGSRLYTELDGRTTFRLGAKNRGKSATGNGGPQSKINQASICFRRGMHSAIASPREKKVIIRCAAGELVGTTISTRTTLSNG